MKKISISGILAIVSTLLCVVFLVLGNHIAASGLGLMAYFAAFAGAKNESARWQLCLLIAVAFVAGYGMSGTNGIPYLAGCLLFLALIRAVRMLFWERLAYTGMSWLEPAFLSIAIGCYVFGNLYSNYGWPGWVFPAPAIAWGTFEVLGGIIDYKLFSANMGYGAQTGKPAPCFTLPDQNGNAVALSDYKGKRHVLLIFVRGDWCPTCHIMLRSYEKYKENFSKKNIMIMAIGPDPVGVNRDMVTRLGIDYKLLCDDKGEAAKAYGMVFQPNNPMTKYAVGVPLPASFLVNAQGVLIYTSNPHKPGEILKPDTIFPVIEKLSSVVV